MPTVARKGGDLLGSVDTVDCEALVTPRSDLHNGFVVKVPSATWGDKGGQPYGHGQGFMVLREDWSDPEIEPDRNVLYRVTGMGDIGLAGNVHIATGLRQDAGYTATQAIWLDPELDVIGIVHTPISGANEPFAEVSRPGGGTLSTRLGGVTFSVEAILTDGSAGAWIAHGDNGAFGTRAFFKPGGTPLATTAAHLAGSLGLAEVSGTSDPNAPPADQARLYVRDNGAGKTQLCVRFATGAVQVISTEP